MAHEYDKRSNDQWLREVALSANTANTKIDFHMEECSRRYASIQRWLMTLVGLGGLQLISKLIDMIHK